MATPRTKLAFTAIIAFLARAASQISTLIVTLIATGYLNPHEFGVFALASIFTTLIRTVLYTGPFEYLLKAKSAAECSSAVLLVNTIAPALLAVLIITLCLILIQIYGPGELFYLLMALAPSNVIAGYGAWRECLLLRTGRLNTYYAVTALTEFLSIIIVVIALKINLGNYALVCQIYFKVATLAFFYSLVVGPDICRKPALVECLYIIRWSGSRYISVVLNFSVQYGADFILGFFLSPAATGLYRASSRVVAAIGDLVINPTRMISMTFFSARASQTKSSTEIWPIVCCAACSLGWPAMCGFSLLADRLVPVLLGTSWKEAAGLVPLLCLIGSFHIIDAVIYTVLIAYNRQNQLLYISVVSSVVFLSLLFVFAPLGLKPALYAISVGAFINTVTMLVYTCFAIGGSAWIMLKLMSIPMLLSSFAGLGAFSLLKLSEINHSSDLLAITLAICGGLSFWFLALLPIKSLILELYQKASS